MKKQKKYKLQCVILCFKLDLFLIHCILKLCWPDVNATKAKIKKSHATQGLQALYPAHKTNRNQKKQYKIQYNKKC